jgi:hypothetical protein
MDWKKKLRFACLPVAVGALASPFGCSTIGNINNPLCCSQFKPGTNMLTVDWGLKTPAANVEFGATMQAVGDFSATAQGMVTDLGVACKGMALDMGVAETAVDPKVATDPNQFTVLWCQQAAMQLGTLKGQITLNVQPAKCDVNVQAKFDCQGQCDASAMCTLTPAQITAACEAGKIAGKCTGVCKGDCEGSANLAVSCNGSCEGTCEGMCNGTNTSGSCMGTCAGKCRGTCTAMGGVNAKCEGTCTVGCDVEFQAPKCRGTFTPPMASCMAKANCQASCDASASAKAECTPPSVSVTATSNIPDKIAALEKWMPQILLNIQGRLGNLQNEVSAMTNVAASFQADLSGQTTAVFCIVPAVASLGAAGDNIKASATASVAILGAM